MSVLRRELQLGNLAEEAPRAVPQVRTDAGHTREGDRRRRRRHGKLTRFPKFKKVGPKLRSGSYDSMPSWTRRRPRTICDWAVYTSFFNAECARKNNAMLAACNTLGIQASKQLELLLILGIRLPSGS